MLDFFQHFIENALIMRCCALLCNILKESYRLGQIANGKCFSPAVVLKET